MKHVYIKYMSEYSQLMLISLSVKYQLVFYFTNVITGFNMRH